MTQISKEGRTMIAITNVAPFEVMCLRGTPLAQIEELLSGVQKTQESEGEYTQRCNVMGTSDLDRTHIINALRKNGTTDNLLNPVADILMNHLPTGWAQLTEPLQFHFQPKEPHYQKQTKIPEAH